MRCGVGSAGGMRTVIFCFLPVSNSSNWHLRFGLSLCLPPLSVDFLRTSMGTLFFFATGVSQAVVQPSCIRCVVCLILTKQRGKLSKSHLPRPRPPPMRRVEALAFRAAAAAPRRPFDYFGHRNKTSLRRRRRREVVQYSQKRR